MVDVRLQRLGRSEKTVREVLTLLKRQPREHYQAWGYGEPSLKSVRDLLNSSTVFGIYLEEGTLVGIVGFTYKGRYFPPRFNRETYAGQYWVHYLVDKEYNGRGLATAALSRLLEILRTETPITRVYAGIYSHNLPAISVIKKLGFKFREERARVQVYEKVISKLVSQRSCCESSNLDQDDKQCKA